MEWIAMIARDLERIEVLSKVADGRMTMVSAAHVLALSPRQVRRLMERTYPAGPVSAPMYEVFVLPGPARAAQGVVFTLRCGGHFNLVFTSHLRWCAVRRACNEQVVRYNGR